MKKSRMTNIGLVPGVGVIITLGFIAVKATEGDMRMPCDTTRQGRLKSAESLCFRFGAMG